MIKRFEFKGVAYDVECFDHYPQHPSWYTHEDEADLRIACWGGEKLTSTTFLDCGAAFGAWTLAAFANGAEEAVAWSPQHLQGEDRELDTFVASLGHNGWLHRARVYESALYDRAGFLNLASGDFADTWDDSFTRRVTSTPRRTRGWLPQDGVQNFWRPVTTLDEWMRNDRATPVSWVKVDVEGAELAVLKGARNTLLRHRPKVVVEHHQYMDRSIEPACVELMRNYGYGLNRLITKSHDLSYGIYFPEEK